MTASWAGRKRHQSASEAWSDAQKEPRRLEPVHGAAGRQRPRRELPARRTQVPVGVGGWVVHVVERVTRLDRDRVKQAHRPAAKQKIAQQQFPRPSHLSLELCNHLAVLPRASCIQAVQATQQHSPSSRVHHSLKLCHHLPVLLPSYGHTLLALELHRQHQPGAGGAGQRADVIRRKRSLQRGRWLGQRCEGAGS